MTIDQTKAMSPTKINVIGEYKNCNNSYCSKAAVAI